MIATPRCYERRCVHLSGVLQVSGDERGERPYCPAFPSGIPADIAHGDNLHETIDPRQVGDVVYQKFEVGG